MLTRRFLGLSLMATAVMAGRSAAGQERLTASDQYQAEGRYLPLYLELKCAFARNELEEPPRPVRRHAGA